MRAQRAASNNAVALPLFLTNAVALTSSHVPTLRITNHRGSLRFSVRVQPRASRSEIVGLHGDALKVRLAAPPVDGAANAALVELLADGLGVPRSCVRIVTGATSRGKVVEVDGVHVENIRRLARQSGNC
jgi:uncharacterized protein (TIGR00251 family)